MFSYDTDTIAQLSKCVEKIKGTLDAYILLHFS